MYPSYSYVRRVLKTGSFRSEIRIAHTSDRHSLLDSDSTYQIDLQAEFGLSAIRLSWSKEYTFLSLSFTHLLDAYTSSSLILLNDKAFSVVSTIFRAYSSSKCPVISHTISRFFRKLLLRDKNVSKSMFSTASNSSSCVFYFISNWLPNPLARICGSHINEFLKVLITLFRLSS